MQIFEWEGAGRVLTEYGSVKARVGRLLESGGPLSVTLLAVEAGGVIGYHPATIPQLFLVVSGAGWVTGTDRTREPIRAGQAAFWQAGERHESGSESGMSALAIEGEGLDPHRFLSPL